MEIQGLSPRQCCIADAIWSCTSRDQVDEVIEQYGREAELVRELILVAAIDDSVADQTAFPQVEHALRNV